MPAQILISTASKWLAIPVQATKQHTSSDSSLYGLQSGSNSGSGLLRTRSVPLQAYNINNTEEQMLPVSGEAGEAAASRRNNIKRKSSARSWPTKQKKRLQVIDCDLIAGNATPNALTACLRTGPCAVMRSPARSWPTRKKKKTAGHRLRTILLAMLLLLLLLLLRLLLLVPLLLSIALTPCLRTPPCCADGPLMVPGRGGMGEAPLDPPRLDASQGREAC